VATLVNAKHRSRTTINQVGGIDNTSDPVTFTVTDGSLLPAAPFTILIDTEVLLVTAKVTNSLTATRAQDGTTIAAHANGAEVRNIISAFAHNEVKTQVESSFWNTGNSFGAAAILGTNDTQELQFETAGTLRGRIGTTGLFAIGPNSSTNANLDINSPDTSGTIFELRNNSTGGKRWQVYSSGSGNSDGAGRLLFYVAGDDVRAMKLTATGNVGLGTGAADPAHRLDVLNSVADYVTLIYNTSTSTTAKGLQIRVDQNAITNELLGLYAGATLNHYFSGDGAVVLNEAGMTNGDVRIEGDTDTNLFISDASVDMVGIGIALPTRKLNVRQLSATTNAVTNVARFEHLLSSGSAANGIGAAIELAAQRTSDNGLVPIARIQSSVSDGASDRTRWGVELRSGGGMTEKLSVVSVGDLAENVNVGIGTGTAVPGATLDVRGSAIFNEAGAAVDLRVEGDTQTHLIYAKGSTDQVGIGQSSPEALLDVKGLSQMGAVGSRLAGYVPVHNRQAYFTFPGTTIDTNEWVKSSTGVTQNEALLFASGSAAWDQGVISKTIYHRQHDLVLEADVTPTASTVHMMIGFGANQTASFASTNLHHAIYFRGDTFSFPVYEDGSEAFATMGSWSLNTTYRVRIVLKSGGGAAYYVSTDRGRTWSLTWAGDTAPTNTPVRVQIAYYGGSITVSNVEVYSTVGPDKSQGRLDWTTFTPVVTQSATITHSVNVAKYSVNNKTMSIDVNLSLTSAGTAGNIIEITGWPSYLNSTWISGSVVGSGFFYDTSASLYYACVAVVGTSGSRIWLLYTNAGSNFFGITPAITAANGDGIAARVSWEIA
jgi:hypothetical protein